MASDLAIRVATLLEGPPVPLVAEQLGRSRSRTYRLRDTAIEQGLL